MMSLCQMHTEASCFSTRSHFADQVTQGVKFKTEGHLRPTGHRAAAQAIKNHLVEEKSLTNGTNVLRTPKSAPEGAK